MSRAGGVAAGPWFTGRVPESPATHPAPRTGAWHRVGVVVLVLALATGAVGALAAFAADDATAPADAEVAAAALALAASSAPEAELSFLPDLAVPAIGVNTSPDVALPVPEVPPADPYAPTPEIVHGTLSIPAIGLSQPLHEGVTLTAINRGPSHWPGTAMPGELGNVVVAGHRTTYTRPFWDLQALEPGDELVFDMVDGRRHTYVLDELEIVSPDGVHIIEQTPARTATLFACHPRGSARQRIVAHFTHVSEWRQAR